MDRKLGTLFGGAKIYLGDLNITGREYQDYRPEEISYIVMRYMIQNADGNLFVGTVIQALKKIWGNEIEFPSNLVRKIYRILRIYKFRHFVDNYGRDCWRVNIDFLDRKTSESKVIVREVTPGPLSIRCMCGAGPFTSHESFEQHRVQVHGEEEDMKSDFILKDGMAVCQICGKEISPQGAAGHRKIHTDKPLEACSICGEKFRELTSHMRKHNNQKYACRICGQMVKSTGMGGHMHLHKETKLSKELLDAIKTMPGLHPREYGDLLGVSGQIISSRVARLKRQGKIKTEGGRQSTRYWPARYSRKKIEETSKAIPVQEKVVVEDIKAEAVPPKSSLNIPGFEDALVFETKDGKTFILKDGELFLFSLQKIDV